MPLENSGAGWGAPARAIQMHFVHPDRRGISFIPNSETLSFIFLSSVMHDTE
jgi:hypothetical protein